MECKKVQDRLLTEYLDRELGSDERSGIEQHLSGCAPCREFSAAVEKITVAPFRASQALRPDEAVWERVREQITAERARSENWFGKLADALAPLLRTPQPVFRAAFVTALVLVVIALARWPASYADPVYGYVAEQMTFMGELSAGNTDLMNGDLKDYDEVFREIGLSNSPSKK